MTETKPKRRWFRFSLRTLFMVTCRRRVIIPGVLACLMLGVWLAIDLLPLMCGEDSWEHYRAGGMFATDSPAMSRDGNTVYLATPCTGHGDIYSFDIENNQRNRLTNDPGFESSPTLSPDGNTLAFVREHLGRRHIWLMSIDGSSQRQLTMGNVLDDIVGFSDDGRYLMVTRSPLSLGMGRDFSTYIIDLRGTTEPRLIGHYAAFVNRTSAIYFTKPNSDEVFYESPNAPDEARSLGRDTFPILSPDGHREL